jgi:hypothetical protein
MAKEIFNGQVELIFHFLQPGFLLEPHKKTVPDKGNGLRHLTKGIFVLAELQHARYNPPGIAKL